MSSTSDDDSGSPDEVAEQAKPVELKEPVVSEKSKPVKVESEKAELKPSPIEVESKQGFQEDLFETAPPASNVEEVEVGELGGLEDAYDTVDRRSKKDDYEEGEVSERFKGSERANRYYSYKGKARDKQVECYECFKTHNIVKDATSSMCPNCGTYISLKDHKIENYWTSAIQTRGNVRVTKKANVKNVSVFCNDLLVEGAFNATVDCSGEFTVKTNTKISGKVNCMKLIVAQGVTVEFERPIKAFEAEINGKVVGDFLDAEKIQIAKKGSLTGTLHTKVLEVVKGGVQIGPAKIGQEEEGA